MNISKFYARLSLYLNSKFVGVGSRCKIFVGIRGIVWSRMVGVGGRVVGCGGRVVGGGCRVVGGGGRVVGGRVVGSWCIGTMMGWTAEYIRSTNTQPNHSGEN